MKHLTNPTLYQSAIFNIVCYICVHICGGAVGQSLRGKFVDFETKQRIPFVHLTNLQSQKESLTDLTGNFTINQKDSIEITHPFYETRVVTTDLDDSLVVIELISKVAISPSAEQLENGKRILSKHYEYYPQTSTTHQSSFEFLSNTKIEILGQSKSNPNDWSLVNSLESLEKSRFKYPDKKYGKVVKTRYLDGDSSTIGLMPFNTYSLSESKEYITILNLKFYNPLHKGAEKRYDYALVDSVATEDGSVLVLYFEPKSNRRFIGFSGLLYFTGERYENWGGYLMPNKKIVRDFVLSYHNALTDKNTRFLHELNGILWLKDFPRFGQKSKFNFAIRNTLPDFNVYDTSTSKWMNMALFDHKKDTLADDTWLMTQMVDKEKLEYIKKDTTDQKFVLSKSIEWMYNIYEGKIGYRMKFFDINNVFSINKFESVRLGFGLQSHENLSDAFTFGGYFGYGIGDGKFKYGGNVGLYIGAQRSNLLSVKLTKDLLEPGQVHYMDKRQDLVKQFFSSRMDDYNSVKFSLRSRINSFLSSSLIFNNFSLKPLYEYYYDPLDEDVVADQKFYLTETSLLLNVGTPFSDNPYLREILYRDRAVKSNLYLNITKGWDTQQFSGTYEYWKLNARLSSNIQMSRMASLNVVFDGGVMTTDLPYPIMYGGPGTEFKLTGIIINNAFQTMKLYGFFADRYVHSFVDYNFGNVIFRNSKFKPELALALNVGWGKIEGRKDIHKLIDVRDYPRGYYEAGVMLNNLLRLKIYKYFYGGLGIGTFVSFGPDAENGAIALRLSYEIGVL